ncbi:member of the major facilitator superfamily [Lentinula aff. detonsa]|uniref:Member of the major facilitator superfamily n=1 Tax=Lentinula aff. detonsa TaxID=2804958 RepID=A0AA38KWM0_9AGAR|nr:member of the major facilitator superfamily [Lentinula aff. detonsa]
MTVDETVSLLSDRTTNDRSGHGALSNYGITPHAEQSEDDIATDQRSLLAIVLPMALGIFLVAMDSTIVVASYASIGNELEQLSKVSWIATGYMLTLTSFQPLYGKLSDIFGRKSCLLMAYMIFALGCLLCGLSRTMDQLIWARALAGIGGGGMSTVVSIILSDIVPLRSRGVWQGVINIVFASGSSVGAPLGGFLADTIGWRWAFLIQFPAVLLAVISVSVALRLPAIENTDFKAKIKRVDFAGAASLVTCIFFLLFGLDNGGNVTWTDKTTLGSLIASVIMFILFGSIEMELAKEPFAPKRIVLNKSLIASYFVNFFSVASNLSMLFHVSLYLQAVKGFSPSRVGFWLVPGIIGGVTGSLGSGLIMKATGKYYWLTVLEYILLVAGSFTIVLSAGIAMNSVIVISFGLVVSGLGNGGGITTSLISLISNAGQKDQAIATAVSYLFRSLGSVVGLSIGSTILQDVLRSILRQRLTGQDITQIVRRVRESLEYLDELDQTTRTIVLGAYEDAIQRTMWFSFSMGICALVASFFIKEVPLNRR